MDGLDASAWRNIAGRVAWADLARLACGSRLLRALALEEGAGRAQRMRLTVWRPGPGYVRVLSNHYRRVPSPYAN